MEVNTLATQIFDTLKLIAPWVSGGLGGAILTIIIKSREKRKETKVITVDVTSNPFSIPRIKQESGLNQDDLSISFKGKPYRNLILYRTIIHKTGNGCIDHPTFVYLFPKDTTIIEQELSTAPLDIEYTKEDKLTKSGIEYAVSLKRIENYDEVIISFLVDCNQPESIQFIPRGLNDVECRVGPADYTNEIGGELENRIRILLGSVALFVLFDAVPVIGGAFKSLVVLLAIPNILYVVKSLRQSSNAYGHTISIDNVSVDKNGSFSVGRPYTK